MSRTSIFAIAMTAICTLQTHQALADSYLDSAWLACQTSSKGFQFRNADYGIANARSRTIRDCTSNAHTNNGQCRYNISCDADFTGSYARCVTRSRGFTFYDGDTDLHTALGRTVSNCEQSAHTNNGECRANVECTGGHSSPPPYTPPPYDPGPPTHYPPAPPYADPNRQVVCSTTSNGRAFNLPGRGADIVIARVIAACRINHYTDKEACVRNAYCQ